MKTRKATYKDVVFTKDGTVESFFSTKFNTIIDIQYLNKKYHYSFITKRIGDYWFRSPIKISVTSIEIKNKTIIINYTSSHGKKRFCTFDNIESILFSNAFDAEFSKEHFSGAVSKNYYVMDSTNKTYFSGFGRIKEYDENGLFTQTLILNFSPLFNQAYLFLSWSNAWDFVEKYKNSHPNLTIGEIIF